MSNCFNKLYASIYLMFSFINCSSIYSTFFSKISNHIDDFNDETKKIESINKFIEEFNNFKTNLKKYSEGMLN